MNKLYKFTRERPAKWSSHYFADGSPAGRIPFNRGDTCIIMDDPLGQEAIGVKNLKYPDRYVRLGKSVLREDGYYFTPL